MSIEDLFRQKLENIELIPAEAINAELMQKVVRKEFMRFIPGKFNIYYLGLIAAAAITAGLILFSLNKDEDNHEQDPATIKVSEAFTIPSGRSVKVSPGLQEPDETKSLMSEQERSAEPDGEEIKEPAREEIPALPATMTGTLPGNILFDKDKNEPEKLQASASENAALFVPSAVSGCAPLKIHFTNVASSYTKFSWSFGDGGYSDKKEPDWIFDEEGVYTVIMNATDTNGKKSSWTVPIKVYPKPKALFEISPENAILPIDEIRFANHSAGASSYTWNFGDGNTSSDFEPTHKYLKYGNYDISLLVESENGCSDQMVIEEAFSGSEFFIEMPNAFIPNPNGPSGGIYSSKSDESAEVFHPSSSGVTGFKLSIYSKVGILIFESNDIHIGWDGYFKGQLCNPGVYIWEIRGNFSNGEPFTKRGDVTLLRK